MDTSTILSGLRHSSYNARYSSLSALRASVKDNNGHLLIGNLKKLFHLLAACLNDENWSVVQSCILLLGEISAEMLDLATYVPIVLPNLIVNLGNAKGVVRRSALSTLIIFVEHLYSVEIVLNALTDVGFCHSNSRVRQGSILAIPQLVRQDSCGVDVIKLLGSLIETLQDDASKVVISAEQALAHLYRSRPEFTQATRALSSLQQQVLQQHMPNIQNALSEQRAALGSPLHSMSSPVHESAALQFGFIPVSLVNRLMDRSVSNETKVETVDEIGALVHGVDSTRLSHHLSNFLSFIDPFLDTKQYPPKMTLAVFGVLEVTYEKCVTVNVQEYFRVVVLRMVEFLPSTNAQIRNHSANLIHQFCIGGPPEPLLHCLYNTLDDENDTLREQVVMYITTVLLQHQHSISSSYDFANLVMALGSTLHQTKSGRLSYFLVEAFAVLFQMLNQSLMSLLQNADINAKDVATLRERFKTGDLAVLNRDGYVTYPNQNSSGRSSEQPKRHSSASRKIPFLSREESISPKTQQQLSSRRNFKAKDELRLHIPPEHNDDDASRDQSYQLTPTFGSPASTIDVDIQRGHSGGRMGHRISALSDSMSPSGDFPTWNSPTNKINKPSYGPRSAPPAHSNRNVVFSDDTSHPHSTTNSNRIPTRRSEPIRINHSAVQSSSDRHSESRVDRSGRPIASRLTLLKTKARRAASAHVTKQGHNSKDSIRQRTLSNRAQSSSNIHAHVDSRRNNSHHHSPFVSSTHNSKSELCLSPSSSSEHESSSGNFGQRKMPSGTASAMLRSWRNQSDDIKPLDAESHFSSEDESSSNASSFPSEKNMSFNNSYAQQYKKQLSAFAAARQQSNNDADTNTRVLHSNSAMAKQNGRRIRGNMNSRTRPSRANTHSAPTRLKSRFKSQNSQDRVHSRVDSASSSDKLSTGTSHSTLSYTRVEQLRPLANPEREMNEVLKNIQSKAWNERFIALNAIRTLAQHHKAILQPHLVETCRHISTEINSLRSSLSRIAIISIADLFTIYQRNMEQCLEIIIPNLMKRAGEMSTNEFLGSEADRAVEKMIETISSARALTALLSQSKSKSPPIRAKVAIYLDRLIDHAGAAVFQYRDYERLIQTLGEFLNDGAISIRNPTKKSIIRLSHLSKNATEFERTLKRHLNFQQYTKMSKVLAASASNPNALLALDGTRSSNLNRYSSTSSNSRRRRNNTNSDRGSASASSLPTGSTGAQLRQKNFSPFEDDWVISSQSRQQLTTANSDSSSVGSSRLASMASESKRKANSRSMASNRDGKKLTVETENFNSAFNAMNSSDWRERLNGLKKLVETVENCPQAAQSKIVTVMDRICERTQDSNSKVAISALRHLHTLVNSKTLNPCLSSVLSIVTEPLCSNMAATNSGIRKTSALAMDSLIENCEPVELVQQLANVATFSNSRIKQNVLPKLTTAVRRLPSSNKPNNLVTVLSKHVLPALVSTLDSTRGALNSRRDIKELVNVVYATLGEDMFSSPTTQKLPPSDIQKLRNMVTL